MTTPSSTKLSAAVPDPHNIEATKYYIFNETGNIMLASTVDTNKEIEKSVQEVFAEVAVFFAAMTRAISTTVNPADPPNLYSLYNYTALSNVIDGSGLFVHVTEEDVTYKSSSVGVDFSKGLIEALLGLATGAGEMSFASAMLASMGNEAVSIQGQTSHTDSKVANIVFICEYLLGMPMVSAIVVYADVTQNTLSIKIGPCFSETSKSTTWILHKDTYMFVTPKFIKKYASDLLSIETDPAYNELVGWLQSVLTRTPTVVSVTDKETTKPAPDALVQGTTYVIGGSFFPSAKGTLSLTSGADSSAVFTISKWSPDEIEFKVTSGTVPTAAPIELLPKGSTVQFASTPDSYTTKPAKDS